MGDFTIHSKMIPVQILEREKNENPLILILKKLTLVLYSLGKRDQISRLACGRHVNEVL